MAMGLSSLLASAPARAEINQEAERELEMTYSHTGVLCRGGHQPGGGTGPDDRPAPRKRRCSDRRA